MSFANHLAVLLIAIFATAVNAQTIGANGTSEVGPNNGNSSAVIGFTIIGNSTTDLAIRNEVEKLINATVNGTEAVRKAISEAGRELVANGNITANSISNFLQAAQRNLTAIGNTTLSNAAARLQEFVQNNREQIEISIQRFRAGFEDVMQGLISAFNATVGAFMNFFGRPLPPFVFPTIPPPSFGGNGSFGGWFGRPLPPFVFPTIRPPSFGGNGSFGGWFGRPLPPFVFPTIRPPFGGNGSFGGWFGIGRR